MCLGVEKMLEPVVFGGSQCGLGGGEKLRMQLHAHKPLSLDSVQGSGRWVHFCRDKSSQCILLHKRKVGKLLGQAGVIVHSLVVLMHPLHGHRAQGLGLLFGDSRAGPMPQGFLTGYRQESMYGYLHRLCA